MVRHRVSNGLETNDSSDRDDLATALQEMMKAELAEHNRTNKDATDKLEARLTSVEAENRELKETIQASLTRPSQVEHRKETATEEFEKRLGTVEDGNAGVKEVVREMGKVLDRTGKEEIKQLFQKFDSLKGHVEMLQFRVVEPIGEHVERLVGKARVNKEEMEKLRRIVSEQNECMRRKHDGLKDDVEMLQYTAAGFGDRLVERVDAFEVERKDIAIKVQALESALNDLKRTISTGR
ncbi:hypothetical protein BLS_000931 [Venturia inaequalis]|uniref:Uncharacterized protein n=1 Tax=Venturia inaequalis TaxID=5025 RepID=A0A8H3Z4L8_VENIN|nr:hypothetical protein BLS_000931 [Venturia inaequalis]KAE9976619.1 hypothetical protein EG327_007985 [Venturia inaequalis]KAE9980472.1 hypothetical protein EG328_000291 [Venturia inaequalis]RDI81508.1 hypothetical protein Vi05172_g8476 [Venturia inaequalis]